MKALGLPERAQPAFVVPRARAAMANCEISKTKRQEVADLFVYRFAKRDPRESTKSRYCHAVSGRRSRRSHLCIRASHTHMYVCVCGSAGWNGTVGQSANHRVLLDAVFCPINTSGLSVPFCPTVQKIFENRALSHPMNNKNLHFASLSRPKIIEILLFGRRKKYWKS